MKKPLLAIIAVSCAVMLSACVNQSPLKTTSQSTISPSSTPGAIGTPVPVPKPTPKPTPTLPPAITVAKPWQSGGFQNGVQVYWHSNKDTDFDVQKKANGIFNYIVGLGANSVGINFPIFVDGQNPTRTYAGKDTPSTHELGLVLKQARAHGLRVTVRPIIDEANIVAMGALNWRGTISPPDRTAWFASYNSFMTPYLQLSANNGVDEFVLGTELSSLQADQALWAQSKASAQKSFKGVLSFAINWTTYQQASPGPFEETGLDAYPQFKTLSDTASVDEVTANWNQWLAATRGTGKTLTLQEVGIPAQTGVYTNPANWGSSQAVTATGEQIQETWFTAACRAAKTTQAKGIYFWNVDINADVTGASKATESTGSFIGRAGETAIKQCFNG